MDKYEKEFSELFKQLAKNIPVNRRELGELRLKRFAAMLYILLEERGEHFDLLTGGGNSGIAVLEMTKLVYKITSKVLPPIVLFPVYRQSNEPNISIDINLIKDQLKDVNHVNRILFVDDEIMRGQTAKLSFETIRDFLGDKVSPCLSCTIVAENHIFVWRHDVPGIAVRFLPFAMVLAGYNGNFGYLIPDETLKCMEPIVGAPIDRNKALALLLGGKVKAKNGLTSYFDTNLESKLFEQVPEYGNKKAECKKNIKDLVEKGIDEYRKGLIEFKYLP